MYDERIGQIARPEDFKYFKVSLGKGEHTIQVRYIADVWVDRSGWVKQYSFRYSLSPARLWKSFGSLEIELDNTAFHHPVTTNLGKPAQGHPDSVSVWRFNHLPADYFYFSSRPRISLVARLFIMIGPFPLMLLALIGAFLLHLKFVRHYRRGHPTKRFSWPVIVGSLILPLFILYSYVLFGQLIDSLGGGGISAYDFFIIFLYPLILPVYWGLMNWQDARHKRAIN